MTAADLPPLGANGRLTPPALAPARAAPYDPLRLCIYATIALLGWLGGPVTLLVFAALGFAGYLSARRAGLQRSRCFLRDTRLVLTYLGLLALAAAASIGTRIMGAIS